ncbi:TIGR04197 family type VII secretion effector [Lachnobacterium bovis]|uniref:TIGR04197 family type VII secretion effector n=1 Tax=Lachnobacterium bovis TaxID=140626 RepID=UPI0004905570|nr:TIGR04197 family type VII secretion effector [Lachnobacterium bovis]
MENTGIEINDNVVKQLTDDLKKASRVVENVSQKYHDTKTTLTAVKKSKDEFSNISQKMKEVKSTTENEAKRVEDIIAKYKEMDQKQGKKNKEAK